MPKQISSTVLTLGEVFALGVYEPASVQRSFKWGVDEADQLLKDILQALKMSEDISAREMLDDILGGDASNDNGGDEADGTVAADEHPDGFGPTAGLVVDASAAAAPSRASSFFVGALILRPRGDGVLELFDGLQRMTTLTILLSILRDQIEDEDLQARLHAAIALEDGKTYRLRHRGAAEILTTLVQPMGEAARVRRRRPPFIPAEAAVYAILRALRMALERRSVVAREALARFLLDHVTVAIISTPDEEIARHAFVATNLYGLRLSRDEIFKGELTALSQDPEEAEQMLALWNDVQGLVTGRDLVMRDPGTGDDQKVGQMEAFLLAADVIERRAEQRADCLGDLITHLRQNRDVRPPLVWLEQLRRLAQAWSFLERCQRSPRLGAPVEHELFKLGCFKWQEWRPLALYWLLSYFKTKREAIAVERFRFLHCRCMAMSILELDADNRAYRIREALRQAPRKAVFSHDTRNLPLNFSSNLRRRVKERLRLPLENYEVRRSLVLWYDLALRTALPGEPDKYWQRASIEHILPRKPDPGSQWMTDFPDAEARYLSFTSIGNLGVIDKRLQSVAANQDWGGPEGKRAVFVTEQQHIKYNSMGGVDRYEAWVGDVISARADVAADFIWDRLQLAEPV